VSRHVLLPFTPDPLIDRPSYPGDAADPGPAAITAYTAQELWIDVDVAEESWLVISGSYYPGWRAWVRPLGGTDAEEQEVLVEKVNGNFRAVRLEPGRWTIREKYSPDPFRFGSFASFLTALGLIFTVSVWAWRLLYRQEAERPDIQRIAKNTLTPIALNLFNKGINFVLTFAMLRILGPAGAGAYRYAIVIYGWFEILSNFGLNVYLTREVARHKDEAGRFFSSTTLLRLAFAGVGIPVLAGFLVIRQTMIAPPQAASTLWAIGLLYSGLFFSTISTGLTALFYAFEKAEYPAAVQTISAFLTTTLGILALIAGWGIVGLAAVSVVVNAATLVLLATLARRLLFEKTSIPFRWTFNLPLLREAVGESFPLMLNHLLATLFFRIDVVLLEALKGEVVVGWYSVVYTWVDAIMVIPSYFTLSLFPVMSRQATEDRPALKRVYVLAAKLMTLIAVPTAIMTTLLAPVLVNVLGGPQYLPHGAIALQIFIWSIVIGWINSVTQYVIIALNRQRALTLIFFVVTAFNIGANLLVIPRWAYAGSAAITILSELVLWVMFYVVVARELGPIRWPGILWRIAAAGALCGGVVWLLADTNRWLAFAGGAAVYVVIVLALRPFTHAELSRLAPVVPAAIRARLIPPIEAAPGE
jgi:O-antigen/teichoic acid export membrane protein